jgi:hypothetical protein
MSTLQCNGSSQLSTMRSPPLPLFSASWTESTHPTPQTAIVGSVRIITSHGLYSAISAWLPGNLIIRRSLKKVKPSLRRSPRHSHGAGIPRPQGCQDTHDLHQRPQPGRIGSAIPILTIGVMNWGAGERPEGTLRPSWRGVSNKA